MEIPHHTLRHPLPKQGGSVESQRRSSSTRVGSLKPVRNPRARALRRNRPNYTVHETDNDMLLIISNEEEPYTRPSKKLGVRRNPSRRVRVRLPPRFPRGRVTLRKVKLGSRRAKTQHNKVVGVPEPREEGDGLPEEDRWGQELPAEILVHIFHYIVSSVGAVPFLCRVSRVCRLWYGAAANPSLWHRVTIGYCWTQPGNQQPPAVQRKIQNTLDWLRVARFSQLREFSLCHWTNLVGYVMQAVTESCPHLTSLYLTNCASVTADVFERLATHCPELESLNLQHSVIDSAAVVSYLEVTGHKLKQLRLTYSTRLNSIFNAIVGGCCSELRLLEVNTEIKQSNAYFQFCIELLQTGCPQLQVLRLLNLTWFPKGSGASVTQGVGFSHLEELCLATSSFSLVTDEVLGKLLHLSYRLQTLDLRGCYRITASGLQLLPCHNLERLFLGLYCSTTNLVLAKQGSEQMALKWRHSLRDLDLTGQCYKEKDLEQAMGILAGPQGNHVLRSLNLAATKVTLDAIRVVVSSSPALSYLNLTSCRCLPRGLKRIYRGEEEIRQFVNKLLASREDPSSTGETERRTQH